MAAVTSYYNCGGFKQHVSMILQFGNQEIGHGSHGTKLKESVSMAVFPLRRL